MKGKKKKLADKLFDDGVIDFDFTHGFETVSGGYSPYYFQIRTPNHPTNPGPVTGETMTLIGELLCETATEAHIDFDSIAGIPNAGVPIAKAFRNAWQERHEHALTCFKLEKLSGNDGGRSFQVAHTHLLGMHRRTLLVDDLCRREETKMRAASAFHPSGMYPRDVLVVVDRREPPVDDFFRVHGVFTAKEIFTYGRDVRDIPEAGLVLEYLASAA